MYADCYDLMEAPGSSLGSVRVSRKIMPGVAEV